MAARHALPRLPASARARPRRDAAEGAAARRLVGSVLRRAARRHQRHRRVLRRAALRRISAGRGAARARAALDFRARRPARHPRLHALLARAARRMAVERDAEPAARGHRESAHWFPFDIYNFASWARATMLPLAVLSARRAVRPLPPGRRLDELFPEGRDRMDYRLPRRGPWLSWRRLFLFSDRFLHLYQQLGFTPFRETAINACLGWIVRHQDADGAWGGIQPPWIYSLMALNVEGYELRHPVMAKGLAALDCALVVRARRHAAHSGERIAGLGHVARAARDAGLRARVHAARWSARSIGCSPTRCATTATGRRRSRASSRAAGRSSART